MRLRVEAAGIAGAIAVVLAGCGGGSTQTGTQSNPAPASSAPTSATTSTSSKDAAAKQYEAAYNTMVASDDAGVKAQNSGDPSKVPHAIQARVSAREQFDSAVRAIAFPSSLSSDAQAVLRADASLEHSLITLQATTGTASTYNAALPSIQKALDQFDAANQTLGNALGLTAHVR